jgi:hypothetical protein
MHACMHAGKVCNKHAKGQADIGGVSSAAGACAQPEQRTASAWMPAALVSRPVKAILRQKTHGKQGGREPASGPPVAARVARATLSWWQQQQQRLRLCGCNKGVVYVSAAAGEREGCTGHIASPLLSPVVPAVPGGCSAITRRFAMTVKGVRFVTQMPTGSSRPQRHAHWAPACGFSSLRRRQPGGAM